MKEHRILQHRVRDIRTGKSMIDTRVMEKNPIDPRCCQHHGIGCGSLRIHDKTFRTVIRQNLPYHSAEWVFANLAQKTYVITQSFQGQAGVGNASSGMNIRRAYLEKLSRNQQLPQSSSALSFRDHRCDIQADMACGNDGFHLWSPPSVRSPDIFVFVIPGP